MYSLLEIENYLKKQKSLDDAIKNLSDLNLIGEKTSDFHDVLLGTNGLERYEILIGMKKLIQEQQELYRNSANHSKGRYWLSLTPARIQNHLVKKTKYKIMYWVNYGDNDTYGWFTVENIMEWFNNPNIKLHQLGGTKEK